MILKNPQGCKVEFYHSQTPGITKVIDYPTGSKTSEVITDEEAQELTLKLLTQNNFKVIF